MNETRGRVLYWTPRVLGIVFALFISLFAFDVFEGAASVWEALLALLIHLIPTALVVIALAIAWRWEWVGAVLFAALGVAYIVMVPERFDWIAYALIAGPAFLLAALFLANWLFRRSAVLQANS